MLPNQEIRADGYPKIKDYSRMPKQVDKVDIKDPNFDKPLNQLTKIYI